MKRNVMNDQEIIALYWAKEERAISATAEKYGNYCHIIAYNILYDYFDAEECVNDTYLRAWNSIPPQRPNRLDAFLGKITRNLDLNRYKHNHAAKRGGGQVEIALSELENCIPNVKGVEQVAEEAWLVSVINRFLFAQAKTKRNIFILRYWFLYSIRDIADMYGERESKIKSLLFRMRNELKKFLEKEDIYL